VENNLNTAPRYNVPPLTTMPVVVHDKTNQLRSMKWGLIPFWAKDPHIGNKLINARAETIDTKPSFRHSFLKRRCLIPANGFYEWGGEGDHKKPYFFHRPTYELLAFAGIYDVWQDLEGKELETFTIITTAANVVVKSIHPRMPVVLNPDTESAWLKPGQPHDQLKKLLQPSSAQDLIATPVSKAVNLPSNDSPDLINPT
jgi:putative SOS response-associated peptidase YedK